MLVVSCQPIRTAFYRSVSFNRSNSRLAASVFKVKMKAARSSKIIVSYHMTRCITTQMTMTGMYLMLLLQILEIKDFFHCY
jgi:hypothetical protein